MTAILGDCFGHPSSTVAYWPKRTTEYTCDECHTTELGAPNQVVCSKTRCQEDHKRKLYARAKLRAKRRNHA